MALVGHEVPRYGCRCPRARANGRLCLHDADGGRPPHGDQPPTCSLCRVTECLCACDGCYPASDEAAVREGSGRRSLMQCECRKLRGGRCKHAILSYVSDQEWFCGHCCDNLCTCACPGCMEGLPVQPYTAKKGILIVMPSGMPSGRSGRSEGWPRGAASCMQSELGLQFYPLDGNGENRCHATVPLKV